jgi:hypothetical protein
MQQGYFCLLQFRPAPEREEGRNVAVVVFDTQGRLVVRALEKLSSVLHALNIPEQDLPWMEQDLSAYLTRLAHTEPSVTALRHFAACEAGQLVLLEPHSTSFEDIGQEADTLFQQLVQPPYDS